MHPPGKSSKKSKEGWTAIGVTTKTKDRFITMKTAFETKLGLGEQTWDCFLNSLLDLGPLTWNFLINETVKSIQATMEPCPFPGPAASPSSKKTKKTG